MEVTLLGTGDTAGTPVPGCSCDTCQRARNNDVTRNRFSVHIWNPHTQQALLVDFSPDFRAQFLRHDVRLPDAGIVTHIHYDHLSGLGNIYRVLDRDGDFPVHTAAVNSDEPSIAATITDNYGYLRGLSVTEQPPLESFRCCGLDVTLVPVDHPPVPCYGVSITDPVTGGQLAISGDTSYQVPDASKTQLSDADLLLVDGIVHPEFCESHPAGGDDYTADGTPLTFGTKHMTTAGAHRLADQLAPSQYRIVHVSHHIPPDQAFTESFAVDGETFSL